MRGILETDAEKRLTIEQIRNHPWYKQHEEVRYNGIIVGTDQIPVDESILKDMSKYDYDLDYSQKCIEANKHNHITATYSLLLKSRLREGKITIKEAFECKNDLTSLMRRHPRFQNLNHNMPEHLKLSSRKDQKPNSMPPKTRIPEGETEQEEESTVKKSTLPPKPLKIDKDIEQEIKSRRRTGSTGGSSAKDAEIIGTQQRKNAGSPSPSPLSHPQFPINKAPLLKQVLAKGTPQITISDSNSTKNSNIIKRERSSNSKNDLQKKRTKISK